MKRGSRTSRAKRIEARNRVTRPLALSRRERRMRAAECKAVRYRITDELQRSYAFVHGIEEPPPHVIGDWITYYTLPDNDAKMSYFDAVLGTRYKELHEKSKHELECLHSKAYRSRRLNEERYRRNQKRKKKIRTVVDILQLTAVLIISGFVISKVI